MAFFTLFTAYHSDVCRDPICIRRIFEKTLLSLIMPQPLKRHLTLQPLSRDHHEGLLLGWKIRQGLRLQIELVRIKKYTEWFWQHHLQQHFDLEEKFVFPVLGTQSELVKKALREHRKLKRLFEEEKITLKNLTAIEELLEKHIRFEERVLFTEIQKVSTPEQFDELLITHNEHVCCESWSDEFWNTKF